MLGKINSIETLGTLDGPGIRFVVFLQGCKLRCLYCHNPETWNENGKSELISPQDLVEKVEKYKSYYGENGGVTFSGGEPLLQPEFLAECVRLLKEKNIHTCLDTAGVGFGDYTEILKHTDLVILDIKAVEEPEYQKITGQNMERLNAFLSAVQKAKVKMWLRQVIVPNLNDDKEHILKLKSFASNLNNVEKVELLPYRTIGVNKYKTLNLPYRLNNVPDLSQEKLDELKSYLNY